MVDLSPCVKPFFMKARLVLMAIAATIVLALGYGIPRTNFPFFIAAYGSLFALYGYWVWKAPETFEHEHWQHYLWAALGLRALLLFAMPELSDDFWRYLWDGRLLTHGLNPYAYTPVELVGTDLYIQAHLGQLFDQLNSPEFYSVYPPVAQALFASATLFFSDDVWGSVVALHGLVLLLEGVTIYGLVKLLDQLDRPRYWAFVYAFNPLIILELSGNLHTESLLAACLVWTAYAWGKERYYWSAVGLGLAVGAKIIPLLMLPMVLRRLWLWKGVVYCSIVMSMTVGMFALFYDWQLLEQTKESMALYFQGFEFNGSVYYYLRYVLLDEYWKLWDYHAYFMHVTFIEDSLRLDWYDGLRRILPLATVGTILWLAAGHPSKRSFWTTIMWGFALHLIFSTTVHPWYLVPVVLWSVLTSYRFPLLWSGLIGLTYITYHGGGFEEQPWVMVVEYGGIVAYLLYEQQSWRIGKSSITPSLPPYSFHQMEKKQPSGNFTP